MTSNAQQKWPLLVEESKGDTPNVKESWSKKETESERAMGNSYSGTGLEENFCVEISANDMTTLRVELTQPNPGQAMKQLGLEPYHMPYYVEYGDGWKSYHDLVGEIDDAVPAHLMWRYVLVLHIVVLRFVSVKSFVVCERTCSGHPLLFVVVGQTARSG